MTTAKRHARSSLSTAAMSVDGDRDTAAATAPVRVAAVNLKLPPFWPSDPDVWFAQVEAQFATRGITQQKTKFDYVVASLSPEFATEVRDLILHPPATRPYDTLRDQLVRRTAVSEQRRLQQLLTAEELGDRKPSQLLRRMEQLLGDRAAAADGPFVRELFLQRLPAHVRMVLASTSDSTSLEDLANLADRVMEVAPPTMAAIQTASVEMQTLRTEVGRLRELVKTLAPRDQSSHNRSPSPRRRRFTPPPTPQREGLCWYHARFGDRARKCTPPCSHSENSTAGR